MHDRASANNAALNALFGILAPNLCDSPCFSYIFIFQCRQKNRAPSSGQVHIFVAMQGLEWKATTGKYPESHSDICRYLKYKLQHDELFLQFSTVDIFVHLYSLIQRDNKSCANMIDILDDVDNPQKFQSFLLSCKEFCCSSLPQLLLRGCSLCPHKF